MQLSKRLQIVADCVTKGSRMADIGCDHAYTSIYLLQRNIPAKVIAMDINKGPLKKANENIRKYGFTDQIETRLSDGAKELVPGEVDTLLISGMGGPLTKKILSDSIEVVKQCKELILQPQSEIYVVREYLHEIGYQIVLENMVIDDGKYYTVIKAIPGKEKYDQKVWYLYGKYLLETRHDILKKFLEHEYEKRLVVMEQLEKQNTEKARERFIEMKQELDYIREGLSYYAM